jgi:mRNA interferase RelE/StbE
VGLAVEAVSGLARPGAAARPRIAEAILRWPALGSVRYIAVNKTLIFAEPSGRAFWKLPPDVQERITRKLYVYGLTGEGDVKRLAGSHAFRMRDGEYRVIFTETATQLTILAVGHRREIYR